MMMVEKGLVGTTDWEDEIGERMTPMGTERTSPAAAALPCGKVLVAGGFHQSGDGADRYLKTAELWDPATGAWSDLPPMAEERGGSPAACVLPCGRVAVVGGQGTRPHLPAPGCFNTLRPRNDCEAFDPAAQTWQPLPPMTHGRSGPGMAQVAGGLVAVGGARGGGGDSGQHCAPDELFDEASGRWFELPHSMAEPRLWTCAVSLPTAALAPAPATAGAASPQ